MQVACLSDNASEWNDFAARSDDAWFWHTTHWMEYSEVYAAEKFVANRSFSILEGAETLAICPVIIERSNLAEGVNQFSNREESNPFPAIRNGLSPDKRQRVLKLYTETLESIAQRDDVGYGLIGVPSVAKSYVDYGRPYMNPLIRYGFTDLSYLIQVIDLRKDGETLWSDVRKGHKSDIKRTAQTCQFKAWDHLSITPRKFQEYQLLHAKDAGGATRSQQTFDLMFSWITRGNAVLMEASHDGRAIGFALIVLFASGAVYGSSCKDPDTPKLASSHLIQWETIGWLKEHGYEWYDIGRQFFAPQWFEPASPKLFSLAGFKRGFGGETIPLIHGEYFYSKDLLRKAYENRIDAYVAALRQNKVAP